MVDSRQDSCIGRLAHFVSAGDHNYLASLLPVDTMLTLKGRSIFSPPASPRRSCQAMAFAL